MNTWPCSLFFVRWCAVALLCALAACGGGGGGGGGGIETLQSQGPTNSANTNNPQTSAQFAAPATGIYVNSEGDVAAVINGSPSVFFAWANGSKRAYEGSIVLPTASIRRFSFSPTESVSVDFSLSLANALSATSVQAEWRNWTLAQALGSQERVALAAANFTSTGAWIYGSSEVMGRSVTWSWSAPNQRWQFASVTILNCLVSGSLGAHSSGVSGLYTVILSAEHVTPSSCSALGSYQGIATITRDGTQGERLRFLALNGAQPTAFIHLPGS